ISRADMTSSRGMLSPSPPTPLPRVRWRGEFDGGAVWSKKQLWIAVGIVLVIAGMVPAAIAFTRQPAQKLDPAAWGSDHVGKPIPEYVAGDECLFCHRNDVGSSWKDNRHNRTVREVGAD